MTETGDRGSGSTGQAQQTGPKNSVSTQCNVYDENIITLEKLDVSGGQSTIQAQTTSCKEYVSFGEKKQGAVSPGPKKKQTGLKARLNKWKKKLPWRRKKDNKYYRHKRDVDIKDKKCLTEEAEYPIDDIYRRDGKEGERKRADRSRKRTAAGVSIEMADIHAAQNELNTERSGCRKNKVIRHCY